MPAPCWREKADGVEFLCCPDAMRPRRFPRPGRQPRIQHVQQLQCAAGLRECGRVAQTVLQNTHPCALTVMRTAGTCSTAVTSIVVLCPIFFPHQGISGGGGGGGGGGAAKHVTVRRFSCLWCYAANEWHGRFVPSAVMLQLVQGEPFCV